MSLIDGMVMEFGVASGYTIKKLAQLLPDKTIYGFDSFKGLPEDWGTQSKGAFSCPVPLDLPRNVELIVGMFEDTLPEFLLTHPGVVSFVHIDCDLYSSTDCVLCNLLAFGSLCSGSVIAFDEIYNHPNYAEHEAKAFAEFLNETGFEYECLGHSGPDSDKAIFRLI